MIKYREFSAEDVLSLRRKLNAVEREKLDSVITHNEQVR